MRHSLPKSLQRFAKYIQDYERSLEDGSHWVYLKPGWRSPDDPVGVIHQIHEDTLSECVGWLRYVKNYPCDCEDCKVQPGYNA